MSAPAQPAVFLDRDGTVIEDIPYLADPGRVRLPPGAAQAIARLREAGYAVILVTNQSALGRGLLSLEGLEAIQKELALQLSRHGARLDAWYYAPAVPRTSDRTVVEDPDRKPGPGLLLRAAREHGIDLERSWIVGDRLSDMLAGRHAGCRGTVLVLTGSGREVDARHPSVDHVAGDLAEAAAWIIAATGGAP